MPDAVPGPRPGFFLRTIRGIHAIQDNFINRRGNHPGLERRPLIKSLGDPANLESNNDAIKRAAEIKQQEDQAPQKIKAIKYLAEIGCGCYPGVAEALTASLEDCTERVRYETARAIERAAGDACQNCGSTSCSGGCGGGPPRGTGVPSNPATVSALAGGQSRIGDLHGIARRGGDSWGQLEARDLDRVGHDIEKAYPPAFRRLIEEYRKALARESER